MPTPKKIIKPLEASTDSNGGDGSFALRDIEKLINPTIFIKAAQTIEKAFIDLLIFLSPKQPQ